MHRPELALIGCGRIGFKLESDPLRSRPCTHFGGASAAGLCFTCAADPDSVNMELFRKISGLSPESCFSTAEELFSVRKPDAAVIAAPTPLHNELAVLSARSGVKALILEKPISHSLIEAEKLLSICRENDTQLIINHERRFDSRYRLVKKLIEQGRIGEIRSVHGRILTGGYRGPGSINEGGGPLLHDGTHLVDIIRFFTGEINSLQGAFYRYGTRNSGYEDRAAAWMSSDLCSDIFLEAGGGHRHFVFETEIFGTEGKIRIGNGYENLWMSRKSRLYTNFRDLEEVPFPSYKKNSAFIELYKELKKILKTGKESCVSTGTDGYRDLEVIHSIYYSASHNRKLITLPVPPEKINLKKIFNLK